MPVSGLWTSTLAAGTIRPLGSETTPLIVPTAAVWAKLGRVTAKTQTIPVSNFQLACRVLYCKRDMVLFNVPERTEILKRRRDSRGRLASFGPRVGEARVVDKLVVSERF